MIFQLHPGTIVYTTNRFSGWSSLEPMWHQVQEFGNDLMNISKVHPEGIHFLGKISLAFFNHVSNMYVYVYTSTILLIRRIFARWFDRSSYSRNISGTQCS